MDKNKKITLKGEKDMPPATISLSTTRVNKTGSWRSIRPEIDYSKCTRCMICWKFCPDSSILIVRKGNRAAPNEKLKSEPVPLIDYAYCKGCGICAEECPAKCIALKKEKK